MISLKQLEKALATLREAVADVNCYPDISTVRDGAIQRFEYTYELTIKMVCRVLEHGSTLGANVDKMNFKDLIREANVRGLIGGTVKIWENFRENRNRTSHAYDERQAQIVFSGIQAFIEEAAEFLDRAERYLGND
ncbi:MAG: nucleotidyltransferase substrate binding protein [Puniceicoccales bacterium]|jgi:nucleotidyltransferase substrate binding protein (TIGR01987 family)|nr:nucleotidyltransferase substrate binding protein [Puniceicoccales bacterium]